MSSVINNNNPIQQKKPQPFQPKGKANFVEPLNSSIAATAASAVVVGTVVANKPPQQQQDVVSFTRSAASVATPKAFQAVPREADFPFLGRFQKQVLGINSTRNTSQENEAESQFIIDPIGIPSPPSTYDNYLPEICDPSTDPACANKPPQNEPARKVMQAAITALNAGLLLQNAATVVRSVVLAQIPQTFTFAGSSINLISIFLPAQAKLPAFVAGLSLSMGGTALALSQGRNCNVDRLDNTKEAFASSMNPLWGGSVEAFPNPAYLRYDGAKVIGTHHMLHPGSMAMLAREQYNGVFNKMMNDWKLPKRLSFMADLAAGTWQLLWMNGKMISNPSFACDALRFIPRAEFVRGRKYEMCNAPEYALAIGAVAPLVLMAGALVVENFQKAKYKLENKFDPTKPNSAELDPNSAEAQAKKQALFQKSTPLQLAANISAILPALANLMFVPAISVAASGNPIQTLTKGTNFSYKITPSFDATLIKVGSIGAIGSALVSTASGLGWMPKAFSDTADLLFLAFSAFAGWGSARNTLATEPRTRQIEKIHANPDQHQNISDRNAYLASQGSPLYKIAKCFGLTPHASQVPE